MSLSLSIYIYIYTHINHNLNLLRECLGHHAEEIYKHKLLTKKCRLKF